MSNRIAAYSSFTFSYLNRARVLAKSVKRFNPDWTFVALISDRPPETFAFSLDDEPFDEVIWLEDLSSHYSEGWVEKHNIIELCTAVKGMTMLELLNRGFDKVFYLDPDVAVFSNLSFLEEYLDDNEILLTPHQLDQSEDVHFDIVDNELCSLTHGVYNLGFVGAANRGDGIRFAEWWKARLLKYCKEDIPNGMFTDQRWCDLVPAFFEGVKIVRDQGCNVASWNLNRRKLKFSTEGDVMVNGDKLKFFHFTKLGQVGDTMTQRYAKDNFEVYELWAWYKREIEKATESLDVIPSRYWFYGEI